MDSRGAGLAVSRRQLIAFQSVGLLGRSRACTEADQGQWKSDCINDYISSNKISIPGVLTSLPSLLPPPPNHARLHTAIIPMRTSTGTATPR